MSKKSTKAFVVMGERGEYSDRKVWSVCVFFDEVEAQEYAIRCQREVRALLTSWEQQGWHRQARWGDDDTPAFAKAYSILRKRLPDPKVGAKDDENWESHHASDYTYWVDDVVVGEPVNVPAKPLPADFAFPQYVAPAAPPPPPPIKRDLVEILTFTNGKAIGFDQLGDQMPDFTGDTEQVMKWAAEIGFAGTVTAMDLDIHPRGAVVSS
jgi:hypothetical protein